jgi:RsiW-degrading membrane proteinase PrsW (M82 family)
MAPPPSNKRPGGDVFDEPVFAPPTAKTSRDVLGLDSPEIEIWEEPARSGFAAPAPETPTYEKILLAQWRGQSAWRVVATFALCLVVSGPCAVGIAIVEEITKSGGVAGIVLFAPLIEEIAKIAVPLILLERSPWRWTSGWQLVAVCAGSGLVFAALENLVYLQIYHPNHTATLALWRWTVCVLLHTGCSTIAGLGLRRIWCAVRKNHTRPQISAGEIFFAAAIGIHAIYNVFAVLLCR